MIKRYIEFIKESFNYWKIPKKEQIDDYLQVIKDELLIEPEIYALIDNKHGKSFKNLNNINRSDIIVGFKYYYNSYKEIDKVIDKNILFNLAQTITGDDKNLTFTYRITSFCLSVCVLDNIGKSAIDLYKDDFVYDSDKNIFSKKYESLKPEIIKQNEEIDSNLFPSKKEIDDYFQIMTDTIGEPNRKIEIKRTDKGRHYDSDTIYLDINSEVEANKIIGYDYLYPLDDDTNMKEVQNTLLHIAQIITDDYPGIEISYRVDPFMLIIDICRNNGIIIAYKYNTCLKYNKKADKFISINGQYYYDKGEFKAKLNENKQTKLPTKEEIDNYLLVLDDTFDKPSYVGYYISQYTWLGYDKNMELSYFVADINVDITESPTMVIIGYRYVYELNEYTTKDLHDTLLTVAQTLTDDNPELKFAFRIGNNISLITNTNKHDDKLYISIWNDPKYKPLSGYYYNNGKFEFNRTSTLVTEL